MDVSSPNVSRNPAGTLDRRYWAALGVIAGLIVIHQVLLQPALSRLTSDAPVINVAGRQRMLSQKLTKAALAATAATDPATRRDRAQELAATLDEWRRAHHGLQQGDAALGLPGRNTAEVERAFADLQPHFEAISLAVKQLLDALSAGDAASEPAVAPVLEVILRHEPAYLERMHAIVGVYESEARQRVAGLQRTGVIVMLAILGVLAIVQVLVVRPAVKLVRREFAASEAQYQRLVESMSDGLAMFDAHGQLQFANARFRKMLGDGDAPRKDFAEFLPEPDRQRLRTAQGAGPLELSFRHAAGHLVDTIVSPQRLDEHGAPEPGWLLVVTDITARKAAEERSRELMNELTHADRLRSMGEMAAGLAHELHQPLGAIANYAEGCLARLPSVDDADRFGAKHEFEPPLRAILRAALRGGEIIRRTRCFAQLKPHQVAFESINDLVREVEQLCLPEARRRGVTISLKLADHLPPLPIDAIQIQQVLTNLIQNAFTALEAVPASERRIVLSTEAADGRVEVSATDSGRGIADNVAAHLFQPFVTTRSDGMGMGLAIVRSIVEAHGGRIRVERGESGGARFCFTLPTELEGVTPEESADLEVAHA